MRKSGKQDLILVLIFVWMANSQGLFGQDLGSEASLDRPSVYVGQPVQVTIMVYTSTWFTSGIDPGNIKVNGAFTVYFRPVSRSFQRNGQTYAGVELIYNVFPFGEDDLVFPSLEIEVESPPQGDYKGVKHRLKTSEKAIKVKPVPLNFRKEEWLVATGLQVTDQWNGNPQQVKVGNVLERSIARTASGTVAELIPPIAWDSLPGVSLYPARSSVDNQKTRTAISAIRTETMRYLFEKEGDVTIPEMVFSWYNPEQEKLYKRTSKEFTIHVQPNSDLGVLASIRDSLEVAQSREAAVEPADQAFTILGLSPKIFLVVTLLTLLAIYSLIVMLRKIIVLVKQSWQRYRSSEAFFFQEFKVAARRKERKRIIQTLYRWIDELKLKEPSVHYFARTYGTPALLTEIGKLENQFGQRTSPVVLDIKEWEKARRKYNKRTPNAEREIGWINPDH